MKAPVFDYVRARSVDDAVRLLSAANDPKALAGSQSLGPMLNLRVAGPGCLVDLRHIDELRAITASSETVTYGAATTHAMFEDGKVPDATRGLLAKVAADIAYRAVRNRGTLGGSLCHADPAADWVSTFALLPATAIIAGPQGRREVSMQQFFTGLFSTAVGTDELLVGVRVTRLSAAARWGYWKFCRKPGEFAEAIGAVLIDPALNVDRAVIGATHDQPFIIENALNALALTTVFTLANRAAIDAQVVAAGLGNDPYERQIHCVALERAIKAMT